IWGVPARSEVNAISCPVGLQHGAVSEAGVPVIFRAPLPSALATQISMFPLALLEYAIRLPSGLYAGVKAWPLSPVTFALLPAKMEATKIAGRDWRYEVYASWRPSGLQAGVMLSEPFTVTWRGL